jgi:hypothetical protein
MTDKLRKTLIKLPRRRKRLLQVVVDVCLVSLALWLAFVVRPGVDLRLVMAVVARESKERMGTTGKIDEVATRIDAQCKKTPSPPPTALSRFPSISQLSERCRI